MAVSGSALSLRSLYTLFTLSLHSLYTLKSAGEDDAAKSCWITGFTIICLALSQLERHKVGVASILAPCALQTSLALSAAIPYSWLPRRLFKLYVKTIDCRAGQETGEILRVSSV